MPGYISPDTPSPLDDGELIENEISIPPTLLQGKPMYAMTLPQRAEILHSLRVSVWRPYGQEFSDEQIASEISTELRSRLGGWFDRDLTPFLRLYKNFASDSVRNYFPPVDQPLSWDTPKRAFYFLAFRIHDWNIQALGDPGNFHCIFLWRDLPPDSALVHGEVARAPFGGLQDLLASAAPLLHLPDRSTTDPMYPILDERFRNDSLEIRSAVRKRRPRSEVDSGPYPMRELFGRGVESLRGTPYFYGARIDLDK